MERSDLALILAIRDQGSLAGAARCLDVAPSASIADLQKLACLIVRENGNATDNTVSHRFAVWTLHHTGSSPTDPTRHAVSAC